MGISLRRMVSWANLHTYVFIILFFGHFPQWTHKCAFSELHDHHSLRKALRLRWRATRDVLRTGSWRLDHSHVEQVCPIYQPIASRFSDLDLCDLQLCRSYPRHHSPYSMRVCVHNMFRYCTRHRMLLTYVGSSFSNPLSLVSTVWPWDFILTSNQSQVPFYYTFCWYPERHASLAALEYGNRNCILIAPN